MEKHIHIATVGGETGHVYTMCNEFPRTEIHVITSKKYKNDTRTIGGK